VRHPERVLIARVRAAQNDASVKALHREQTWRYVYRIYVPDPRAAVTRAV
jgi:hypothetical protein